MAKFRQKVFRKLCSLPSKFPRGQDPSSPAPGGLHITNADVQRLSFTSLLHTHSHTQTYCVSKDVLDSTIHNNWTPPESESSLLARSLTRSLTLPLLLLSSCCFSFPVLVLLLLLPSSQDYNCCGCCCSSSVHSFIYCCLLLVKLCSFGG